MPGELMTYDDGPPESRCVSCGVVAVGPCARCESPVCGDCCVLTTGSVRTFAICLRCERRAGSSLGDAWAVVLGWILKPVAALLAALVVLYLLFGDR